MTVPVNDRRREYQGNGVATVFNGPMAFEKAHVRAYLLTGGNVLTSVPLSAYDVTNLGRLGGTKVTMNVAPAANQLLTLLRTVPFSQEADITNQGAFLPETIEKAFDSLGMQIQQLVDGTIQLVFENGEFVWDAKGSRIVRVGDAKADMDAVNLRSVYAIFEAIQGGGGSIGVTPLSYEFVGGDEETDFFLPGATVDDPRFYDTYIELTAGDRDFVGQSPDTEYQILLADDGTGAWLRFATPPADGIAGFTVLRGYARPYIGPPPITTLALKVRFLADTAALIDNSDQNGLVVCTSASDVALSIREGTGAPIDWKRGEFFSVRQAAAGVVTVAMEGAGTLIVPVGYQAKTRGLGSIISFTCEDPDTDTWVASGDLLRTALVPIKQCWSIHASDLTTNLTAGTNKVRFFAPFALGNITLRASVTVAQAAGSILTFDVNKNGVSMLTTRLTIDNAEFSTTTAATPPVMGTTSVGSGDEIAVDIDQVGTALAKGLIIYVIGEPA